MFYNKVYQGDCKDVLLKIPEESVDLVYLDPPFFANRYSEVIWEDGSEEELFKERRKGGIQTFISWMKFRMQLVKRVLKDTGSVYLHCDYRASHYLKQMMDDVFDNNFRNDIIWGFRTGGAGGKEYAKKHNNILFYTKSSHYYFKPENDIYYLYYPSEKGTHPYFISYPALTKNFDREDVKLPEGVARKETHMRDLWDDDEVKPLWNMGFTSEERMKYKGDFVRTQKPENLLKRIITTSCKPGGIVLDPFGGSGTTLAAAEKLNRKWIGIDVSPNACKIMEKRMGGLGTKTRIDLIMPESKEFAVDRRKLGFDFQDYICDELGWISTQHTSDGGVDGTYYNEKGGECYGQVKLNKSGRPTLQQFIGSLTTRNCKEGTFIADDFARTVYAENEKAKKQGFDITLMTKKELFEFVEKRNKERIKKLEEARKKYR